MDKSFLLDAVRHISSNRNFQTAWCISVYHLTWEVWL